MAEERPGLSDHRQQGRQLQGSRGESQEMATGCRETQTGREARIKREISESVSQSHQPQGVQQLGQFRERSAQFGIPMEGKCQYDDQRSLPSPLCVCVSWDRQV